MDDSTGMIAGAVLMVTVAIALAFAAVMVAAGWKVFTKAGQPGWAVLVPLYNILIMLRIVGRPDIWLLYCLIPGVNVVIQIILCIDLAKSFGKDTVFAIGMILLPVVFVPILGFGDARYLGPQVAASTRATQEA
jgi:Family of unknown function (DUF5684)